MFSPTVLLLSTCFLGLKAVLAANLPGVASAALSYEQSNYVNGLVETDPFYTNLAPNTTAAPPGTVLRLEPVTNTSLYTLPPTVSLARMIYQSLSLNGTAVPVSAYILFPYTPHLVSGKIATVAYAHGSSGATANCAPSHIRNLWQHFLAPFPIVTAGQAVVATDYAGLGVHYDGEGREIVHEYMASPAQSNDLIYSVQAAQSAFPELSKEFVVMGHSQGGGAVLATSERVSSGVEGVEGYLGGVAVSPVVDILGQAQSPEGAALLTLPGLKASNPNVDISQIATPYGLTLLNTITENQGCQALVDAIILSANASLIQPNWIQNPAIQQWRNETVNGNQGVDKALLIISGTADQVLDSNVTLGAVRKYSQGKQGIQGRFLEGVGHVEALQGAQKDWMDWIRAKFDGVGAEGNETVEMVGGIEQVKGVMGEVGIQKSLNWYLAPATEFWETP